MDIQVVLEASAVATVIGAGISYLTFRNSSKLTYITQERKEWRAEIRKIAEKLEECPYENRKQVLVKLKTRINAYGKFENRPNNEGNPLKDAHIWDCIQMIETCPKEKYDELRELLIELLSLLLKDDWERAKQEVTGEPARAVAWIFFLFAVIVLENGVNINLWGKVTGSCVIIAFVVAFEIIFHCQVLFADRTSVMNVTMSDIAWILMGILGAIFIAIDQSNDILVAGGMFFVAGLIRYAVDIKECSFRRKYKSCVKRAVGKDYKNTAPKNDREMMGSEPNENSNHSGS